MQRSKLPLRRPKKSTERMQVCMSELTTLEQMAIWGVLGTSLLGLVYAFLLRGQILREDKGTPKMQEIWGWIKDGANAYLSRQLRSILPFIAVLTVALFFSVYIVPPRCGSTSACGGRLRSSWARCSP
jgi:hypothetical protein